MKKIFIVIVTFLSFITAEAQDHWQQIGPFHANVLYLAKNNSGRIFLSHDATGYPETGVYISDDNANSWTKVLNQKTLSLLVGNNGNVFAGTESSGIYRSTDSGSLWEQKNDGLDNLVINALATNSDGYVYAATNGGIFRSTNNGDNWISINTGLQELKTLSLFVTSEDKIFAGFDDNGTDLGNGLGRRIFYSTDDGNNWNFGGNNVFEVWCSDGEVHTDNMPGDVNFIFSTSVGSLILLTQYDAYRSTDNGNTWWGITCFPYDVWNRGLNTGCVTSNGDIYVGFNAIGILKSTDDGLTWSSIAGELGCKTISSFLPLTDGGLYVGTKSDANNWFPAPGLYFSQNGGTTWKLLGLSNMSVEGIIKNNSDELIVSAQSYFYGSTGRGIYISADNGLTWIPPYLEEPIASINYPKITKLVLGSENLLYGLSQSLIYKSTDGGHTFSGTTSISSAQLQAMSLNISNNILYIGGNLLKKTTDGGSTWIDILSGISHPYGFTCSGGLYVLSNGNVVVSWYDGLGYKGVYISDDEGQSWDYSGLTGNLIHTFKEDNFGRIIAGGRSNSGGAVFISTDNGLSWNSTAYSGSIVYASAVSSTGRIFVGGADGLYYSDDSGLTWTKISEEFSNDWTKEIFLDNNVGVLVGTDAHSIVNYSSLSLLPVELSAFSANIIGSSVGLKWRTETEINNYGFEIERKLKNTEWKKIGFVNGSGNSNSPKNYAFIDKSIENGKYFYRLKQIDNDGKFEYSNEIEITIKKPIEFTLAQNFPNPFNPSTTIYYELPTDSYIELKIFDVLGREVKVLESELKKAGKYNIEFDGSILASGIYFYQIKSDAFVSVKKMLLIK